MTNTSLELRCCHNLGESILWDDRRKLLWWVDIHLGHIWSFSPESTPKSAKMFPMPTRVGAIGLTTGDHLVVAFEKGFGIFHPGTGQLEQFGHVEVDLPTTRLNDGRVDPAGRFICGGMDEATPPEHISGLYRLTSDRNISQIGAGIAISNALCWSPDGRTMYFTDMPKREIHAYDYDLESGTPSNPRLFADMRKETGLPDGAITDSEGCLWVAVWRGSKIQRYTSEGKLDLEIAVPALNPTCLTFGGADLKTLYISSAWLTLTEEERKEWPLSGSLFSLQTDVMGTQNPRFNLDV